MNIDFVEHVKWIFSGIGVLVISLIIHKVMKNKKDKSGSSVVKAEMTQKSGNNSTNYQTQGNITVNLDGAKSVEQSNITITGDGNKVVGGDDNSTN